MTSHGFNSDIDFYSFMNSPYMKEKINCGCGIVIQRRNSDQHDKTIRHLEWEKNPHDFFNKQLNCKCGLKYVMSDKDTHLRSKEHKARIYQKRRDDIKIKCECGSSYSRYNEGNHRSTKKHQAFITSQTK